MGTISMSYEHQNIYCQYLLLNDYILKENCLDWGGGNGGGGVCFFLKKGGKLNHQQTV